MKKQYLNRLTATLGLSLLLLLLLLPSCQPIDEEKPDETTRGDSEITTVEEEISETQAPDPMVD